MLFSIHCVRLYDVSYSDQCVEVKRKSAVINSVGKNKASNTTQYSSQIKLSPFYHIRRYDRVNNLKQMNPEMKTLLGVGGWMMGSKDFSRLAASRIARRLFAKTSAKFLRDRNFDGLTIDWQHPTKRGGKPQDKVNFSLLLQVRHNERRF